MAISPKLWQIATVWRYDQSQLLCLSCIRGLGSSLGDREDDADHRMGIQRCGPTSLTVGGQTLPSNEMTDRCAVLVGGTSWLPLNSSGGRALTFGVSCCCAPAPASRTGVCSEGCRVKGTLMRRPGSDQEGTPWSVEGGVLQYLIGSRCMMAH